ncbi:MAG: GNAT family N-acetyltransferase [Leptonema sp. (in: bacteria)]
MNCINSLYALEQEYFEPSYSLDTLQKCFRSNDYNIFLLYYFNKKLRLYLVTNLKIQIIKLNKENILGVFPSYLDIHKQKYLLGYSIVLCLADFSLEILRIAIKKEYRNHGLGTILLERIIHFYFFEKNFSKIFLEVSKENKNAIELYLKFGFKNYLVRKKYYQNAIDGICMILEKKFYSLNQSK